MTEHGSRRSCPLLRPLALAVLCGALCAGARTQETRATVVRLLPFQVSPAQSAGCLVAKEKGFYARRGIDVEILREGPACDPLRALEEGKTDFAVLWLVSALTGIDRGVPLTHVAQVFASPSLAIVAWRDRGVARPGDLAGRRVGLWSDPLRAACTAWFRSQEIAPTVVTQHATVSLFLLRAVDASCVTSHEYHAIRLAGVDESELTRFLLADHGLDFPEDGLYCLRRTRTARPDASKALAAGTFEGWRYAADHPEEALDLVMREVRADNLPTNRVHMRWTLQGVLDSVFPPRAGLPNGGATRQNREPAVLSRQAFDDTVRRLIDINLVRGAPSYDEFVR